MKPPINAKQARTKDLYLQKNYNITLAEYDALRRHQDYKCAICRADELNFKNGMAVDHCHKTGEVRGLLCWKCNRALGKFEDSVEKITRAAAYVTTPPVRRLFLTAKFTAPGKVGTAVRAKALAKLNGKSYKPKRRKSRGIVRRRKRPAKS